MRSAPPGSRSGRSRSAVRDVAVMLERWLGEGRRFALATIARTWSSAPRPAGAMMAVDEDGQVLGSLSGGCVEGAVHELALEVLADGAARAAHYGISGQDALAVGLTCGGHLDVLVRLVDPAAEDSAVLRGALRALTEERPVALAVRVATGTEAVPAGEPLGRWMLVDSAASIGSIGPARLDDAVVADARGRLGTGRSDVIGYGPDGGRLGSGVEVLVVALAPRPRFLIFGAIDYARALAAVASFVGYAVTVCDARAVFATPARFPEADEVVDRWPHQYLAEEIEAGRIDSSTVLAVLTHDPKFDVPLLEVALRCDAGYIGAMGSCRTNTERERRLRDRGMSSAELARLHAPIGLDLGARTPEATAVSIMAEVIQHSGGGSGRPLREISGPVHPL